jgi:cysteinyl-tRNA synthetase
MGRPVDLVIATDNYSRQLTLQRPVMGVAPVHYAELFSETDPASVRFTLARVPYAQPVDITGSVLDQAHTVLARWRERLEAWGRHPSRPIPPDWRTAAVAVLDDNLDVSAVVTMLLALEDVDDIEPGVKFEAFAYLDRVLAVDLARELGRSRR